METRLTLRPGMPGTKKLVARFGERLVCVRYLYDPETAPADGGTTWWECRSVSTNATSAVR
jgi:hypothetical protein